MKYQLITFLIFMASTLFANEIRISLDNDLMFDTDRHYTHGTMVSYSYDVEPYTHFLLRKNVTTKRFSIGQFMYTPSDIRIEALMTNDRPYSGVLFGEFNEYMPSKNRMQSFSTIAGMIGPSSFAEDTQKYVHKETGSQEPKGWGNQLDNEVVLNVVYTDTHRLFNRKYVDFLGHYGSAVGNMHTYANTGFLLKFGWDVPKNYSVNKIEPLPRKIKIPLVYGFVSCEGRGVLQNIFLDGNTFSESHSVDKEPLVGDFSWGFVTSLYNIDILYSYTYRSKEFKIQEESSEFGNVSIAYRW